MSCRRDFDVLGVSTQATPKHRITHHETQLRPPYTLEGFLEREEFGGSETAIFEDFELVKAYRRGRVVLPLTVCSSYALGL